MAILKHIADLSNEPWDDTVILQVKRSDFLWYCEKWWQFLVLTTCRHGSLLKGVKKKVYGLRLITADQVFCLEK